MYSKKEKKKEELKVRIIRIALYCIVSFTVLYVGTAEREREREREPGFGIWWGQGRE